MVLSLRKLLIDHIINDMFLLFLLNLVYYMQLANITSQTRRYLNRIGGGGGAQM